MAKIMVRQSPRSKRWSVTTPDRKWKYWFNSWHAAMTHTRFLVNYYQGGN